MTQRLDVAQWPPRRTGPCAAWRATSGERRYDRAGPDRARGLDPQRLLVLRRHAHPRRDGGRESPAGELFAVGRWRDAPFFDERERAALALTDAVTRLGARGVPDDVWDTAAKHSSSGNWPTSSATIATIDVWNRISVPTGRRRRRRCDRPTAAAEVQPAPGPRGAGHGRTGCSGLAYRLLGSVQDAEDVCRTPTCAGVASTGRRSTSRAAICPEWWPGSPSTDCGSGRPRETTWVPWLPEPVATAPTPFDPFDTVEQRDSVSTAMLHLMERLAHRSGRCSCCAARSTCPTPRSPPSSTGRRSTAASYSTAPPYPSGAIVAASRPARPPAAAAERIPGRRPRGTCRSWPGW